MSKQIAACSLIVFSLAMPLWAADWPCFQQDPQHTGVTTNDFTLPLKVLWEKEIGRSTSQAMAVDGKLYLGRWDGDVLCMDQKTGEVLWTFKTGGKILFSACVSAPSTSSGQDGKVFIGSADKHIYCLSIEGKLIWKFLTGDAIWSSPVVGDGLVFCGSKDGNLYALKMDDGKLAWKHDFGSPVWSSPAYHDGVVFCGSKLGKFAALEAKTGKEAWTFQTYGWMANNSPSISGGKVYVASMHQQILPETGEWHIWTQGAASIHKVLAEQNRTQCIFCLDEKTGKVIWGYPTPEAVLSKGGAIDQYGLPLMPCFSVAGQAPALSNGKIYMDSSWYPFGDGSRWLVIMDMETGKLLAQSPTGGSGLFAGDVIASAAIVTPQFCLNRENAFDVTTAKRSNVVLGRTPGMALTTNNEGMTRFTGIPSSADGVLFVVGGIRHSASGGNGFIRAFASGTKK